MAYLIAGIAAFLIRRTLYDHLSHLWAQSLVESLLCVSMCMGLLVIAERYFSQMSRVSRYLSDHSFGIYLFHLLIVIALQMLLKEIQCPTWMKFVLVSVLGIVLSALLNQLLRKIPLVSKVL